MTMRTLRCSLEDLVEWFPQFFLAGHIAAGVAVLGQYTDSPAVLTLRCENVESPLLDEGNRFLLEVTWGRERGAEAARLRMTVQSWILVEYAAVALALILAKTVAPVGPLEVMKLGDRADYWSPEARQVLEVSDTESPSELGRRHREKVAQAKANPFGWESYVVVCAFSARGHQIRLSAHR